MKANEVLFVEDMPCFVTKVEHNGEFVLIDESTKTLKRTAKPEPRQITTPPKSTYQPQAATIRLETFKSVSDPVKRLRVHSDGKVKTPLSALAKAHQLYAFKRPAAIISDAGLFNLLTEKIDLQTLRWIYTQRVLPVRNLRRVHTLAPAVNASVVERVGELFTAILLFKGIGYEDVKRDLALARQSQQIDIGHAKIWQSNSSRSITYNVNTLVTYNERQFKVHKITVKKTTPDGLFFCSKSCKPVAMAIQAVQMANDEAINAIE